MRWRAFCPAAQERLAVLGLALAVRSAVLLVSPEGLANDPDGYRRVGENLLQHGLLGHGPEPSAIRPPLYPLILAGCGLAGPARGWVLGLVHVAMGVGTVGLAWDLAYRCGLGRWQRWLVAGLVTGDPLLVRASTLVMTETLATLLATAALNLWARYLSQPSLGRAFGLGALMGLGVLCRPEWLVWMLALAGLVGLGPLPSQPPDCQPTSKMPPPTPDKKPPSALPRSRLLAYYALGAGLALAPWTIRNALRLGWPIFTTTHGGYTMFLANNPWLYQHLAHHGPLSDWDPEPFHRAWHYVVETRFLRTSPPAPQEQTKKEARRAIPHPGPREDGNLPMVKELEADRWAYQQAWKTIRQNPAIFCRAVGLRWARLWRLMPCWKPKDYRMQVIWAGSLVWYLLEFGLAIWGIWALWRKTSPRLLLRNTLLLALLWALLLSMVHAFYWTEMRMRCPLTTGLALAAGSALEHLRQKRSSPPG